MWRCIPTEQLRSLLGISSFEVLLLQWACLCDHLCFYGTSEGMFLAGPVSQDDYHNTKTAPLQISLLKLLNDQQGAGLLKDQRPNWTHVSSCSEGRLQIRLIITLSHKTGVNGGLSHESVRQIHERRAQCTGTQRYESHCYCRGCASKLYCTNDGTRRKFLPSFLHYSLFGELYHIPSLWSL